MIHLPLKNRDIPPNRLSVAGALRQIQRAINGTDGEEYNHSYYPHDDVLDLLRAYSIHKEQLEPGDSPKCNYCESQIEKAVTLQVEHYRPKAKVEAGENDHLETAGYYWLGLEWTNLLLACPKCNGKDAKGNKFPIRGIRAQPHNPVIQVNQNLTLDRTNCYANREPLSLELPILLNPEIDHPENFLTFDLLGEISGHGQDAERGEVSKDTYKLNREPLFIARQKMWNELKKQINEDVEGHQVDFLNDRGLKFRFRIIAGNILKRKLPSEEFTLWGRYINDHLHEFLADIGDWYRDLFMEIYNEVLNEQMQAHVQPA